ncbi:hypothetical protein [Deinococcus humi]|uniref:Uncharacterized protein n=1 Tax=Deinococcus humi TaxID=662880 RepID=A0A7W8JZX4_9DEIO|nr:hypothetical protein [Deinococcus humi]MBB5366305.1 hypothetical protein [Deinococcus humi]
MAVTRSPSRVAVVEVHAGVEVAGGLELGGPLAQGVITDAQGPGQQLGAQVHHDLLGRLTVLAVQVQPGGQEDPAQLVQPHGQRPGSCRPSTPAPFRAKGFEFQQLLQARQRLALHPLSRSQLHI